MKYILSVFCFLILHACSPKSMYSVAGETDDNSSDLGMPIKPGSCYAKCLIQAQYEEDISYYVRYTGVNPAQEGIKTTMIIKDADTMWEYKEADRSCLSENPADCLVWCLVDIPSDTIITYEVIDTVNIREFEKAILVQRELISKGGLREWREIVCDEDVSTELDISIQQRLLEEGYLEKRYVNGYRGAKTKSALVHFQREKGLPIGGLNLETLDALGIRY